MNYKVSKAGPLNSILKDKWINFNLNPGFSRESPTLSYRKN